MIARSSAGALGRAFFFAFLLGQGGLNQGRACICVVGKELVVPSPQSAANTSRCGLSREFCTPRAYPAFDSCSFCTPRIPRRTARAARPATRCCEASDPPAPLEGNQDARVEKPTAVAV